MYIIANGVLGVISVSWNVYTMILQKYAGRSLYICRSEYFGAPDDMANTVSCVYVVYRDYRDTGMLNAYNT